MRKFMDLRGSQVLLTAVLELQVPICMFSNANVFMIVL